MRSFISRFAEPIDDTVGSNATGTETFTRASIPEDIDTDVQPAGLGTETFTKADRGDSDTDVSSFSHRAIPRS